MQHDSQSHGQVSQFRVRVGHATVRVQSDSPEAAIRAARRQLCDEMPRMWDVICGLSDCRFEVVRETGQQTSES